jgi:hypothetical protein
MHYRDYEYCFAGFRIEQNVTELLNDPSPNATLENRPSMRILY